MLSPIFAAQVDGAAEWLDLFEGDCFDQWTRPDGSPVTGGFLGGWRIEQGVVERYGLWARDIVSKESFADFELQFEWKVSTRANSGVKYRLQELLGPEYQVLDDHRHPDGRRLDRSAASLYDVIAVPEARPLRLAGEWNAGLIRAQGTVLEHWLNGERVVCIDLDSERWQSSLAESKFSHWPDFGSQPGPILLQDHGDRVWFRNVKIRRLPAATQAGN